MASRFGTGSTKGRRRTDDTPLSDGPISKAMLRPGKPAPTAQALRASFEAPKKHKKPVPTAQALRDSFGKGLKLANARALSRVVEQQDAPIRGADHFEAFTGSPRGRAQLESLRRGAYANSKLRLRSGKAGGHKTTMSRIIDSGPLTRPETISGLQSGKAGYRGPSGYKSSGVGKGLSIVRRLAGTPAGKAHTAKIGPAAAEISQQHKLPAGSRAKAKKLADELLIERSRKLRHTTPWGKTSGVGKGVLPAVRNGLNGGMSRFARTSTMRPQNVDPYKVAKPKKAQSLAGQGPVNWGPNRPPPDTSFRPRVPKQGKKDAFGDYSVGKAEVSKTRSYDPEHRRQQGLGAGSALLAVGGGVAGYKGVKGIVGSTKAAHKATGISAKLTGKPHEKAEQNRRLLAAVKGGVSGSKRDIALTGGGMAALGGAGGIQAFANSRRGKAWD